MEKHDTTNFFKWLAKSKAGVNDIIDCRKMQNMSISESENTFKISTLSVCGFVNNDVVKLGGEIKQQYDEDKATYYNRVYSILIVCADLMDSVNEVLADEGAWSPGYFAKKLTEWRDGKLAANK